MALKPKVNQKPKIINCISNCYEMSLPVGVLSFAVLHDFLMCTIMARASLLKKLNFRVKQLRGFAFVSKLKIIGIFMD